MNKLERTATIIGLLLGIASIFISMHSNSLAQEANNLTKEQQSAHTLLLGFAPIKTQIVDNSDDLIEDWRASCLYRIELLNIGGQADIVESLTTNFMLYPDDNQFLISNLGKPIIISKKDQGQENLLEGVNSIAVNILSKNIENLNAYDWSTNPDGMIIPFPINPNETKVIYLLYTVNYSSKQKAYSWIGNAYDQENILMDNESTFPIDITLNIKSRFSNELSQSGRECLSLLTH